MKYKLAGQDVYELADELIFDDENNYHVKHLADTRLFLVFAEEFKGRDALKYAKKPSLLSGIPLLQFKKVLNDRNFEDPADHEAWQIVFNHRLWKLLEKKTDKQQVLHHYLLRCGEDEDGNPEPNDPDIIAFTEEVGFWGKDLPSAKRLLEALEKKGQPSLNFDGDGESDPEPDAPADIAPAVPYAATPDAGDEDEVYQPRLIGQLDLTGTADPRDEHSTPMCANCMLEAATHGKYCDDCRPRTGLERLDAILEREESEAAQFRTTLTKDANTAGDADEFDTGQPPAVTSLLERQRAADYGASEEDVPMVANRSTRRRIPTDRKGATA